MRQSPQVYILRYSLYPKKANFASSKFIAICSKFIQFYCKLLQIRNQAIEGFKTLQLATRSAKVCPCQNS